MSDVQAQATSSIRTSSSGPGQAPYGIYPGPKPRRKTQKLRSTKRYRVQTIGFDDLPREVRDRIYFRALRPDCGLTAFQCFRDHECVHNGSGRTKLLVLNKRIHRQAVGLLLAHEQLIHINGQGARVFRNMRAFGKPGFFAQHNRMSQTYIPPPFCELQMVQLRYLALQVDYPLPNTSVHRTTYFQGYFRRHSIEYEPHLAKLKKEIREVEGVLRKCRDLQTFRLLIRTESVEYSHDDEGRLKCRALTVEDHRDLEDLLLVFLNAAKCKQFKTAAQEHKTFLVSTQRGFETAKIPSYEDPIVRWYNRRAENLGIHVKFEGNHHDRVLAMRFEHEEDVPRTIHQFFSGGLDTDDGAWIEVDHAGCVLDTEREIVEDHEDLDEPTGIDETSGSTEEQQDQKDEGLPGPQGEEPIESQENSEATEMNNVQGNSECEQQHNKSVEINSWNLEEENTDRSTSTRSVCRPPEYRYFMKALPPGKVYSNKDNESE